MKRVFLVALILVAGTSVFCALQDSAVRFREEFAARRADWIAQTRFLEQVQTQHTELTTRIRELKQSRLHQPQAATKSDLVNWVAAKPSNRLSPELREALLTELGFDWNSMAEYLVVSKETLRNVGVEAMRAARLTDAACGVLAITPEERAGVEALAEQMATTFSAWAVAHVQRGEPEGNMLANYTMPLDAEFSQSLSNTFSASLIAALGAERGELLLDHARLWMADLGMRGGTTVMTIKRHGEGEERLGFELKTPEGGTMSTDVTRHQPFPEAFRPVFPGGWADLAEREGFELPKDFNQ